jgi:hypothetical protein
MNQENMFLFLENWRNIEFLYLLYFDRVISNMQPRYENSFLLYINRVIANSRYENTLYRRNDCI